MTDAFFREWLEYFRWNAEEPDTFPWQSRETLPEGETARLGRSIATFQLGENSDGGTLLKFAGRFAERDGKGAGRGLLPLITALFIAEERNHSALLGRFMDKHGIPRLPSNWTDAVFRHLRKPFGLEVSLSVLITAEIIALVYYRALREATSSRLLRALCNKILEDEKAHVDYESALIRAMQEECGPFRRGLWRLGQELLFMGTVLVVYRGHRGVLEGGGYPFLEFYDACRGEFRRLFPGREAHKASRTGENVRGLPWPKA